MRHSLYALVCGAALMATADQVQAAAVNLAADRQILSLGNANDPPDLDSWNESDSSLLLGIFNSNVSGFASIASAGADGFASQNSNVSASAISGSGSVGAESVFTDPPTAVALSDDQSLFEVAFDLLTPHLLNLSGGLDASGLATGSAVVESAASFVLGEDGQVPLLSFDSTGNPVNFNQINLLLAPGSYTLVAQASSLITSGPDPQGQETSQANGFASFNFDLTLTEVQVGQPIPEPSTLLLLGTGLLGMVGYARRRAA